MAIRQDENNTTYSMHYLTKQKHYIQ